MVVPIEERLIDELERIRESGILVIVEGLKDKRCLASFGIKNVLTLKRPLFEVVETVAATEDEVVLLTDLDVEGKKLYSRLSKGFQKHKVKVDNKLRKLLFLSPISHVEGLNTFLRDYIHNT